MSKKNKAKLNTENGLEKDNSYSVDSKNKNLDHNSADASNTSTEDHKQNETEENLRNEIEQQRGEKLRLLADMENLRKRSDRERIDTIRYGSINFARDILSLGDNLSRALDAIPKDAKKTETITNLINGLRMVQREFATILAKHGIKKIEALSRKFDHNFHQAMMEIESEELEEGLVAQEIQSGYTMHDRLLRPSMVGVAKKPDKDEKKK